MRATPKKKETPTSTPTADGPFTVVKIDADQQLVFGWANVAIRKDGEVVTDHHDDEIDPGDLERAAYLFNLEFRELNERHRDLVKGRLVESLAVTPEKLIAMGLEKDALPQGWWVGFYVEDDDVWDKVKKGEYSMFSIEGSAARLEEDDK
jgi:hypothetical protein